MTMFKSSGGIFLTVPKALHSEIKKAIDALSEGIDDGELEPDFSVDDEPWIVQLKKGCKMLEVSKKVFKARESLCRTQNYTLAIETAFASMERTIHAYLLKKGILEEKEKLDKHTTCFEMAGRAGIFDEEASLLMIELWERNRSQLYYRHDIPSKKGAQALQRLADMIHRYIVETDPELKECCQCKRE